MTHRHAIRCATAAVSIACAAAPALGGVRRHDRDDQLYIDLANQPRYASVGDVLWDNGRACGTLIAPGWVLTAGHVTDTTSTRIFTYGGTSHDDGEFVLGTEHFPHFNWVGNVSTGWDLGLIRLAAPVTTITPASRFTGNELNRVGTSVGFGVTGVGTTGHEVPGEEPNRKRAGTNALDARGNAIGWSSTSPSPTSTTPATRTGATPSARRCRPISNT